MDMHFGDMKSSPGLEALCFHDFKVNHESWAARKSTRRRMMERGMRGRFERHSSIHVVTIICVK
jgi:hypothetical protein